MIKKILYIRPTAKEVAVFFMDAERKVRYLEVFDNQGEIRNGYSPVVFRMQIESPNPYGNNAQTVAEAMIGAVSDLFTNHSTPLKLQIVHSHNGGASGLIWEHPSTHQSHLLLITNGRTILTSDPAFISLNYQTSGIGIMEHQPSYESYSQQQWVRELMHDINGNDKSRVITDPISIEQVGSAVKRVMQEGVIKSRRKHF